MKPAEKLTGAKKAAILLLCLGEKAASRIFEALDDGEVRDVSRCMMNIECVDQNLARAVLDEYKKSQGSNFGVYLKGDAFVRKAILGGENHVRADYLIDQVMAGVEGRPLETISKIHPRMVANLLKNEHPQTVALILSTQREEHASRVVLELPEELRGEVMYRIAKLENVSPESIVRIEDALQREIGVVVGQDKKQVDGVDKVVEILGHMEKGADKAVLAGIEAVDAELAEAIRCGMFTFEDLIVLDGHSMQSILREISNDSLTLALKTASDGLKSKILSNISQRAAAMIEEDLEVMGPRKLSEVEAMQTEIVKIALRLEEEGTLIIPGRGGDGDVLV